MDFHFCFDIRASGPSQKDFVKNEVFLDCCIIWKSIFNFTSTRGRIALHQKIRFGGFFALDCVDCA